MQKKIFFLINPKAGGNSKSQIAYLINKLINKNKFYYTIIFSANKNETIIHTKRLINEKADAIVAVGGDGTINDIASCLSGTQTALSIIPAGSGNGLARHLNIPLKISEAIEKINNFKIRSMDAVNIGNRFIFNVGGIGFDAHTGALFNTYQGRGLTSYTKAAINVLKNYKPINYKIKIDDSVYSGTAFMISIANASQYGYNARINPNANVQDGKFEICFLKPFPGYRLPELLFKLFNRKIQNFTYWESISCQKAEINELSDYVMHYDGELCEIAPNCTISICVNTLKVVY